MHSNTQKQTLLQNCTLLFSDMVSLCISYALAFITRGILSDFHRNSQYYFLILGFAVTLCLLSYIFFNLNHGFLTRNSLAEFFYVAKYDFGIGAGLGLVLFLTQNAQDFSRLAFVYFLIYNFFFTFLFHLFIRKLLVQKYFHSSGSLKIMIISETRFIGRLLPLIRSNAEWAHEITSLGLIDQDHTIKDDASLSYEGIPVVASKNNLYDCLSELVVDEVLIYLPSYSNTELGTMIRKFEMAGIVVHVSIDPYDHLISHKTIDSYAGLSVMTYSLADYDFHRIVIKRIMDILGSLIGLVFTVLLTPFIALAIKLDSPGPVFYRQKRIGLNGREFQIVKFRSMYMDADEMKDELLNENEMSGPIFKITNDPRITKVGRFLRQTSLDELPQFYNILIGQMSLVGTRPPTPDEYTQYKLQYRRRLSIKPGLTGLWQVSGRSDITDFEDVLRLDLHYIDHWSLGLDIKILLKTLGVVFHKRGAK